jgi:hypothetical protein
MATMLWSLFVLAMGPVGCTYVYQPMAGLHGPVVADPTMRNFPDVALTVHCVPTGDLTRPENRRLCRRIGELFENQGATVEVVDTVELSPEYIGSVADAEQGAPGERTPDADLVLQVRSLRVDKGNSTLSWALCIATFSLVPAVDEETFGLDVQVRDGSGFLLAQDSMKGRVIRRFGSVTFVGNRLMDWAARDKDARHRPDAAERELSKDLYGQLTQVLFNARMRSLVQQEASSARGL